jgi:hypothetical protein
MIMHQAIIMVRGGAANLRSVAALGVMAARRCAARPIVRMHEAVIVEVTAGGGIGHRRQLQSRIAHNLNTRSARAFHCPRWGERMNAVNPLTRASVNLETV